MNVHSLKELTGKIINFGLLWKNLVKLDLVILHAWLAWASLVTIYRIETVRNGLTNPSCTSTAN